jgi:integral membrane sensor domain MASE1
MFKNVFVSSLFVRFWRHVRGNLLLAVAYYALAELSRQLASTPQDVTPVWPPDGLAVAVVFLWGRNQLYGVFWGSFLANIWAFWNLSSWGHFLISTLAVLGIAIGTTLGTWLGRVVSYNERIPTSPP